MAEVKSELNPAFEDRLAEDGYQRIGHFSINGPTFAHVIEIEEARRWLFSVYAWVSFEGGGRVLRVGKSEGELKTRIGQYEKSLNNAMNGKLEFNQYYMGDTPPWERDGWIASTAFFGEGLIFAKQVPGVGIGGDIKKILQEEETRLIRKYDPPLCNTTTAGRALKRAWIVINGNASEVRKRSESSF